jgi:hypothetical protein
VLLKLAGSSKLTIGYWHRCEFTPLHEDVEVLVELISKRVQEVIRHPYSSH